jgi:DNA-directed RNA polymerase II subunit RPB1
VWCGVASSALTAAAAAATKQLCCYSLLRSPLLETATSTNTFTGNVQPAYKLDGMKIMVEFPAPKDPEAAAAVPELERKQELSARAALRILDGISDEDCRALGFNPAFTRPNWLMISVLPVPPPPVRPSVMMDSSARCESEWGQSVVYQTVGERCLRGRDGTGETGRRRGA